MILWRIKCLSIRIWELQTHWLGLLSLLIDLTSYYSRSSTLTRQVMYSHDSIIMKMKVSSNCRYRTSLVSIVSCFVSLLYSHIQFRQKFSKQALYWLTVCLYRYIAICLAFILLLSMSVHLSTHVWWESVSIIFKPVTTKSLTLVLVLGGENVCNCVSNLWTITWHFWRLIQVNKEEKMSLSSLADNSKITDHEKVDRRK